MARLKLTEITLYQIAGLFLNGNNQDLEISNTNSSSSTFSIWTQYLERDIDAVAFDADSSVFVFESTEDRFYLYKSIVVPTGVTLALSDIQKKYNSILETSEDHTLMLELESGSIDIIVI